jgi:hypothetical protein
LKACHVGDHLIDQCRIAQVLPGQLPHTLIDAGIALKPLLDITYEQLCRGERRDRR